MIKKVIISKYFIKNTLILLCKYVRIEKIFKRGGRQLKNLVVKTALITLAVVLSVTIVTFALLTAFAPGVMFKVTSGLGMDKTALSFAVRYYEKTDDVSDLAEVVYLASETEDYDCLAKYSKKLIDHNYFFEYAESQADGYVEYVMTNYVFALVESGNQNAWFEAFNLYDKFYTSYVKHNPIFSLVRFTDSYDVLISQKLYSLREIENDNNLLEQDLATVKTR